jgi:hypothetical protein
MALGRMELGKTDSGIMVFSNKELGIMAFGMMEFLDITI